MLGSPYVIEVSPRIPPRLARLAELSNNLWYSWDRPTRELFARLHPELWEAVGHSPKAFLKRVDEYRLNEAVEDPVFLYNLNRILSAYDTYHSESGSPTAARKALDNQVVAYFNLSVVPMESRPNVPSPSGLGTRTVSIPLAVRRTARIIVSTTAWMPNTWTRTTAEFSSSGTACSAPSAGRRSARITG